MLPIGGGKIGHQRNGSQTRSQVSNASSYQQRSRVLQIKGHEKQEAGGKPRFNENVEDEVRSIRQEASTTSQKLKINMLGSKGHYMRNQMDKMSNVTGNSLRSAASHAHSLTSHNIPRMNG